VEVLEVTDADQVADQVATVVEEMVGVGAVAEVIRELF
jgi:hypothetical protein